MLAVAGITAAAVCLTAAPSATAEPVAKTSVSTVAETVVSAKDDGENVFRGLFFAQGKVGNELAKLDLFSEARQYLDNNSDEEIRAADAVMDLINEKSPDFFAQFSDDVRSGNPRRVEQGVVDAQDMLLAIAQEADANAAPVENGQLCGVTVAVAAAVVHVAAVITAAGAVVTVTIAVGANFVKGKNWFWSPEPISGDGSQLSKDEAVAQVTEALKA
ncbi:sporulation delaying protein family toxin [Streptomyces laurentii]|uniref:sporulation delaying protein family toxin n=1 Tax=Streptomyces laurentii TaxID=39478 RepID=UPI00369667F3